MSKHIKARSIRHRDSSIGAREIALAGLGAASLARKQVLKSLVDVSGIASRLPEASASLLEGLTDGAQALKSTATSKAAAFRRRADSLARLAGGEVRHRIAPLLAKLGVSRKTKARKPVASKRRSSASRNSAPKRNVRNTA
jgi:hypothetical protein